MLPSPQQGVINANHPPRSCRQVEEAILLGIWVYPPPPTPPVQQKPQPPPIYKLDRG